MDDLPVNVTDIAVVVILLVSGLLAYARGFVHEVLAVGGWIGAIFATIYGFPYARPYARDLIPIELIADLAAGLVIFVVTLVLLSFVTRGVAGMVKASALNFLDRSLGFLFGLVRGGVIVCVAYLGAVWLMAPGEQPGWLRAARSMPLIERGADILRDLVPDDAAATGSRAAGGVQDQAEKILETQKIFRDMLTVEPKASDPGTDAGYSRNERRDMERLIEGSK